MLHCEYCNYYKTSNSGNDPETEKVSACLFTDHIFIADMEKSDMEYPCKDATYQDYLNRKKTYVRNSQLRNDDWKFAYKSKRPTPERERSKVAG
ncbi:MAG: hypothetical protein N2484_12065 [Clostridia bacterium]|nr:hypothetical protein [Clostridia bacterium]